MELLKARILKDGKPLSRDVLLVDAFLNHQVDPVLMDSIGDVFAEHFGNMGITRVATIESSGIAPALMTALKLHLPLVIMKKSTSHILSEELLQTPVFSFTKGASYQLTLKKCFMEKGERILFIDDFLANGQAVLGAANLIEQAGATLAGIGIVIEKAFQPGHRLILDAGYPEPYALASIAEMDKDVIEFENKA